jgi:nucleoside-diphosphate-sugar epimerase
VTGATGYIGRQVLEPLRRRGFEVHAADRAHGVDLRSAEGAGRILQRVRPTHLLHLAWYVEHGSFWTSEENLRWVDASLRLLQAFAAAGGERAVIAGSCAEYAWAVPGPLSEETTPLRPSTLYGACKRGLHEVARGLANQDGFALAWGRIFFSFGPGEPPGRLVPSIATALLEGREAPMTHGRQVRDFVSVEDLGRGFAALVDSDVTGPVNVASGTGISLVDVATMIARAAGRPELLRVGALPERPGEPPELVADVTRLHDEVGWAPEDEVVDRLARLVAELRGAR